tara:strand:+ start:11711 stop:12502 length:792 start_codon:yes stop_codon:yes gene_type:complete
MTKKLSIFISLGVLIYLLNSIYGPSIVNNLILVQEEELRSLKESWASQVGRPPNEEEVEGIIKQLVDEEILYREAMKLGLDKGDIIIKRRLAQKISFLQQEFQVREPSKEELEKFFIQNRDKYLIPRKFSFTHIYFNQDKDGLKRAEKALMNLSKNLKNINGDPFLLGKNFVMKTPIEIERSFGQAFLNSLKKLETNLWVGPISSIYGSHIVNVRDSVPAKFPNLDEVEARVREDLQFKLKSIEREDFLKGLRKEYSVEIQSG